MCKITVKLHNFPISNNYLIPLKLVMLCSALVEKKARAAEERRVNDQQWRERMEAQESIKRLLSAQVIITNIYKY